MNIDWKRKLTSRKFWAAVAGFVSMLLIYIGKDAGAAEQIVALIMAGGSLIAYIIGEGLADGGTATKKLEEDESFQKMAIVNTETNEQVAVVYASAASVNKGYELLLEEELKNE